jgi:drug/metabolite transporter (DMT)-like permease
MSTLALALVLAAAVIHASWNYVLKLSGGGIGFLWLATVCSTLFYVPLAIAVALSQEFFPSPMQFGIAAVSSLLHAVYFILLDRGYRFGDLSVVYPLARATGPLITVAIAIALLGETPTPLAVGGALLIGGGAFLLTGTPAKLKARGAGRGVAFALFTGAMIASYSIWDKQAVAVAAIPPLIYDWLSNLYRCFLLFPLAWRRREGIVRAWHSQRSAVFAVSLLAPLSYILVLTAMVFTPVSYIAPAREISILIAAVMGTQLLNEGDTARKLTAAAAMMLGVVALALG